MGSGQEVVLRDVLETNNVLSALLFPDGRLTWMRTLWASGRINPLCSRKTATELVRVLAYPQFQLDENEIREVLDSYLLYVDVVDVPDDFGARPPSCRTRRTKYCWSWPNSETLRSS